MKLRSLTNQLSGTVSSHSLLQIIAVLLIAVVSLSMLFPAHESVAGDAADDVADAIAAVGIIAGGVALVATAPLTGTIATGVAVCAGAYYAGYKLMGLFLDDDSSS